jgi:hypothetical protein
MGLYASRGAFGLRSIGYKNLFLVGRGGIYLKRLANLVLAAQSLRWGSEGLAAMPNPVN